MEQKFDSLIFDMDGTLWDAVDTYCKIWNTAYSRMGITAEVTRHQLLDCMGLPLDKITDLIAPAGIDRAELFRQIKEVDDELMPKLGGTLYPGVARYIPELARHYKMYMVSNCGEKGLEYFLKYTGLAGYFTDTLTNGETGLPKEGNIRLLMERHDMKRPMYIGDTQGDCDSAHAAGIPMIHAAYGFGSCQDAEMSASSFNELADMLLN